MNVVSDITLPPSLTEIGIEAFHNCSSLTEIALLPNLKKIGDSAFDGCSSLNKIGCGPAMPWNTVPMNSTLVGGFSTAVSPS